MNEVLAGIDIGPNKNAVALENLNGEKIARGGWLRRLKWR